MPSSISNKLLSRITSFCTIVNRQLMRFGLHIVVIGLLLMIITSSGLYYAVGTPQGTHFLIDKVSKATGVVLKYSRGNFRDGLVLKTMHFKINDDLYVRGDGMFIKIGWQSLFDKHVHLRDFRADHIHIYDQRPLRTKPFDYRVIKLPFTTHINRSRINRVDYHKVGKPTTTLRTLKTGQITWQGTHLKLNNTDFHMGYINADKPIAVFGGNTGKHRSIGHANNINASIRFEKDYPVNATGQLTIKQVKKHYIGHANITATGTLKNLQAQVSTRYNKQLVQGTIDIQPMLQDAPFTARVHSNNLAIVPYAKRYNITLHQPQLTIKGTWKKMGLSIKSRLSAKHIPSGYYQGEATLDTRQQSLNVQSLNNHSSKGTLFSHGQLDWQKDFWLKLQVRSRHYPLDTVLFKQHQPYRGYLPTALDGTIDVHYQRKNAQDTMQIDSALQQNNGEKLTVKVIRLESNSKRAPQNYSYQVNSKWHNINRTLPKKLDIHNIKQLITPTGTADLIIRKNLTQHTINGTINANLTKMSIAPKGTYKLALQMDLNDRLLKFSHINFQGAVGGFVGTAKVRLPHNDKPTKNPSLHVWLDGRTDGLYPHKYSNKLAIKKLTGSVKIKDVIYLTTDADNTRYQRHVLTFDKLDITTVLMDKHQQKINVQGTGKSTINMIGNDIGKVNLEYRGGITHNQLPQGCYHLLADSNASLDTVNVKKLQYQGDVGYLAGSGKLQLHKSNVKTGLKSISWQLDTHVDTLNLSKIYASTPAIITGRLATHGTKHITNTASVTELLHSFPVLALQFDGQLKTDKLPTGRMVIDAQLDTSDKNTNHSMPAFRLHTLQHSVGNAKKKSDIKVAGKLSLNKDKQLAWQLTGSLKRFNVGYFYTKLPTNLTGQFATAGTWLHNQQDISLNKLNITGSLAKQKVKLTGSLHTKLTLPKDIKAFIRQLPRSKDTYTHTHQLIKQLQVKNLHLRLGDDFVKAHGNLHKFNAHIDINSLHKLHPQLTGQISGLIGFDQGQKRPTRHRPLLPTLDVDLMIKRLHVKSMIINKAMIKGTLKDLGNDFQIMLDTIDVDGSINKQPVQITGGIRTSLSLPSNLRKFIKQLQSNNKQQNLQHVHTLLAPLNIQALTVRWGKNSIKADGNVQGFTADLNLNNLKALHSSLTGKISGLVSLDGLSYDLNKPFADRPHFSTLDIDLLIKHLRINTININHGTIKAHVKDLGSDVQVRVDNIDLDGTLKQSPLHIIATIDSKLSLPTQIKPLIKKIQTNTVKQNYQLLRQSFKQLHVTKMMIGLGTDSISADGNLDSFEADIDIQNLDKIHPDLQGHIAGFVGFKHGDKTSRSPVPIFDLDLVTHGLTFKQVSLDKGSLRGQLVNFAQGFSQLDIFADKVAFNQHLIHRINTRLTGTLANHEGELTANNKDIKVLARVTGALDKHKKWRAILSDGFIHALSSNIKLKQQQPSKIVIDAHTPTMNMQAHCWSVNNSQSKVCLNNALNLSKDNGQIDLRLHKLDTALLSFATPKNLIWDATINGFSKINWQKGKKPSIEALLSSDNGSIGIRRKNNNHSYIDYKRISIIGLSVKDGLRLRTEIHSDKKNKGFAEVVINPYKKNKPIKGKVVLQQFDIAVLRAFFPAIRSLKGSASLDARVNGDLQTPRINGEMNIKNASLSMIGIPMNLRKFNSTLKIKETTAQLSGSFYSGKGKGIITGDIDWRQALQAKLAITGKRLEISEPPLLSATFNPDINVIIKPQQKYAKITGAISIPTAVIRPPDKDTKTVKKSTDINVFDKKQLNQIEEVFSISKPWSLNAELGIDLGDKVIFKGFGAQLPLAGAVVLKQSGTGTLQAKGVVQIARRNNINVFGQNIELSQAQVRFNNDLKNPNLNINVTKKVDDKNIGFKVKGTIKEPKIKVFNNAGLSEQEVMNALLTGKFNTPMTNQISSKGFHSEITNNLVAAGLGFGLQNTNEITNEIGKAVGLQSLTLSASGGSNDANINVTGYITPDLYIRYAFGVFNAQNELSTSYQLTQKMYLKASSMTEKFIDLVYGWNF